jgi:hypothetical protein
LGAERRQRPLEHPSLGTWDFPQTLRIARHAALALRKALADEEDRTARSFPDARPADPVGLVTVDRLATIAVRRNVIDPPVSSIRSA